MAEWSNAAVLKTVEAQVSGGSNPSLSASPSSRRCMGYPDFFSRCANFWRNFSTFGWMIALQ